MPEFNPLVSIIIPVYNGENYLNEAIDSAINQSYRNFEIIVINDGSTDGTEEIALSYKEQIRYYRKDNGGQSTALNFGIEKMKGEYFSWLSHDDLYHEEKLSLEIKRLKDKERVDAVVYSDWEKIDAKGNVIGTGQGKLQYGSILFDMLFASPINGCTLLIPKRIFDRLGNFNPQRPHTSDVELFFKMAQKVEFLHIPKSLVKMRVHQQQATFRNMRYHIYESNLFLMDAFYSISTEGNPHRPVDMQNFYRELALNWSKRGYRLAYRAVLKRIEYKTRLVQLMFILKCYRHFLEKRMKMIYREIIH